MLITNKYANIPSAVKDAPSAGSMRIEGMAGLAKGLAILEVFGSGRPSLTISEAAEATGTTRAAARRCLLQLVELGYLIFDNRQFRPTPRLLRLGTAYLATATLPQLAQPHLAAARNELGESVSLTVLDDGFSVFVARSEAERVVSTGFRLGVRAPAWSTAAGRVLLGALSEKELRDYLASVETSPRTRHTVTDRKLLAAIVRESLETGYSINNEELEIGMRSLAVPVRDAKGTIVAAVSSSTFVERVSLADMEHNFLPVLQRIGHGIEMQL